MEDKETSQGKVEDKETLMDMFSLLHSLAQLLQLEVPHAQTLRLCQDGGVCEEFATVTLSRHGVLLEGPGSQEQSPGHRMADVQPDGSTQT